MRKDKKGNLSTIYETNRVKAEKIAINSLKDIPNSRLIDVYLGDYNSYTAKYEVEGNEYKTRVSYLKKNNFVNNQLLKGSFLYAFFSDSELLYIGKSSSLNVRLSAHFCEGRKKWKDDVTDIKIAKVSSSDMHILEPYLIIKYSPKYNKDFSKSSGLTIDLPTPNFRGILFDSSEVVLKGNRFLGYYE